jgi:hypothetical protein
MVRCQLSVVSCGSKPRLKAELRTTGNGQRTTDYGRSCYLIFFSVPARLARF